ncbi:MAG: hypothetical protein FD122_3774, partial [Stygiobacter sp.]
RALNESKKREIEEKFGANFGETSKELSPEMESEWLDNIKEFESLHEDAKMVTVHKFVGSPVFKPLNEIPTHQVHDELEKALEYLSEHNVDVDFLAEVSDAEAYRFVTEELMRQETDDIHMDGWTTNYIYEEFYPNLELDAKQFAEQFLWHLFDRELEYAVNNFAKEEVYDSNGNRIDTNTLKSHIEQFYAQYVAFPMSKHTVVDCEVVSDDSAMVRFNSEWSGLRAETMELQSFSGTTVLKMKKSPYGGCDVIQANVVGVDLCN